MTSAARFLATLLVALSAASCSTSQPPLPPPDDHRVITEGYSLLYKITAEQREMKKLLLIKIESDPVDRVISEIAEYTDKVHADLEDMARRYPAIMVEPEFLPAVEVKTRESISSATSDALLSRSGKEFERLLLLKQMTALEQERHMSKVMAEIETADERRAFWRRLQKGFGELESEVEQLLEERYFCN